jgi:hypothetical protein
MKKYRITRSWLSDQSETYNVEFKRNEESSWTHFYPEGQGDFKSMLEAQRRVDILKGNGSQAEVLKTAVVWTDEEEE